MRRLGWLAAALLATASGAVATSASAALPPLATRGTLGAETILSWSGAKAIRLAVPAKTYYRDGDVDLAVTGASYAFVRLVGPPHADCPTEYAPRCATDRINWVSPFDNERKELPRTRRHDAYVSEPPVIDRGYVDVYLFTDGRATLTIRTTTLRGRTAYRPAATFRGLVAPIPVTCAPLGCADSTGRTNGVSYGGRSYDLQGTGWAEVYAMHFNESGTTNQLHTVAGCQFPNWKHPAASPDAADHPYGCDDTSDGAGGAVDATAGAAGHHVIFAGPSASGSVNIPFAAKGKQYVGFQATGAGPNPSRTIAYGIWFRYF